MRHICFCSAHNVIGNCLTRSNKCWQNRAFCHRAALKKFNLVRYDTTDKNGAFTNVKYNIYNFCRISGNVPLKLITQCIASQRQNYVANSCF